MVEREPEDSASLLQAKGGHCSMLSTRQLWPWKLASKRCHDVPSR